MTSSLYCNINDVLYSRKKTNIHNIGILRTIFNMFILQNKELVLLFLLIFIFLSEKMKICNTILCYDIVLKKQLSNCKMRIL